MTARFDKSYFWGVKTGQFEPQKINKWINEH